MQETGDGPSTVTLETPKSSPRAAISISRCFQIASARRRPTCSRKAYPQKTKHSSSAGKLKARFLPQIVASKAGMKQIFLALAGLATILEPGSALARGLEGRWKNGAMEIVIAPCGGSLCGTVVKASQKQLAKAQRGSGTHLIGTRVINHIQPLGPGRWNADVFVASRDLNARGTIEELGPDRMAVHGCVLGVICKTTHWDRIG